MQVALLVSRAYQKPASRLACRFMRTGNPVTVEHLLSELRTLDIRLYVEGDRLRCSAPRGCLTAEIEQEIAALKPQLLQVLRPASASPLQIPKRTLTEAGAPLSFAQERFWFLQNLDPESADYNITARRRFSDRLDASQLQKALEAVMDRHAVLRTC